MVEAVLGEAVLLEPSTGVNGFAGRTAGGVPAIMAE
jgi:hypothetical protein